MQPFRRDLSWESLFPWPARFQRLAMHTFLEKISRQCCKSAGGSCPAFQRLTPAQIRHIYSLDQISNLGHGQTIAIVDAYDDPNIFSDADTFDNQFMTTLTGSTSYYAAYGASSTWLTKLYASGTVPSGNTGWGQEISLDVEWMHAIAPQAKIVLVEAASDNFNDLLTADSVAVQQGATVVSNSWGGGEFSGENSPDSYFSASHVTFVFSAGDNGDQSYPAESPNVLSVGGTTLCRRQLQLVQRGRLVRWRGRCRHYEASRAIKAA